MLGCDAAINLCRALQTSQGLFFPEHSNACAQIRGILFPHPSGPVNIKTMTTLPCPKNIVKLSRHRGLPIKSWNFIGSPQNLTLQ
jgi:hypothetical protein